jgi:phenylalanyl-tRNA synthetase beta chain
MDGDVVAQFGRLDGEVAAARKMREDVFVAEIFADQLLRHDLRQIHYRPVPKYPAVERDFSFLFSDAVTFGKMEEAVLALNLSELRSFRPAEIFRGGSVPAGQYSILLRAIFQSHERTLREDEVADWAAKVVEALARVGGTQRA